MGDKIKTQLRKVEQIKSMGRDAYNMAEAYGIDAQTAHFEFIDKVDAIPNLRQWARSEALAYVRGYRDALYARAIERAVWVDGKQVRREDVPEGSWARGAVLCLDVWIKSKGIVFWGSNVEEQERIASLCPEYARSLDRFRKATQKDKVPVAA